MGLFAFSVLVVGAVFAFILAVFFLFLPHVLKKMNEFSSKMILRTEDFLFQNRTIVGIALLAFCAFLIFIIYTKPLKI
jgi:hypothetical protein